MLRQDFFLTALKRSPIPVVFHKTVRKKVRKLSNIICQEHKSKKKKNTKA